MIRLIVSAILQSVLNFFVRWYGTGSQFFWSRVFEWFASLDRTFGVAINARLIMHPLYGDYSPVGRVIGPVFRLGRIALGAATYALLFVFAGAAWLAWLAIPALLLITMLVPARL